MVRLSRRFRYAGFCNPSVLPQPRDESRFGLCPLSLAATDGIHVCLFSSGYLDVSVPRVRSRPPIHSAGGTRVLPRVSFLIRTSPDQRSLASFPELIAGCHVLRRFSMPRHPPCTLKSLTTFTDHRPTDRPGVSFPGGPAGRAGARPLVPPATGACGAGETGNGSSFAEKGARRHPPDGKDQNQTGSGDAPECGGCRGGLLPTCGVNLEPQKSFTCQRAELT